MGSILRRIGTQLTDRNRPTLTRDLPTAVGLAVALFVLYAAFAPPGLTGGDGAELLYGLESFQTVHSPGYPLYLTLGRALLRTAGMDAVPGGHLLSALFAALALAVLYLFLRDRKMPLAWSGLGVLFLAGSYPIWQVSVQVEVYSLALLFFTGSLLLWSTVRRWRGGYHLFAFWVGLSLTHHPMAVLNLLLYGLALRRDGRSPGWETLHLMLPSGLYLLLLVPGSGFPFNWPQPGRLNDVVDHVSARTFGDFVLRQGWWSIPRGLRRLAATHLVGLPGAVLLVAAVGYWRGSGGFGPLIGLQVAYCGLLVVYDVADLHHFLLPSLIVAGVLATAGLHVIHRRAGPTVAGVLAAACLISLYGYGVGLSLRYDYRDHTYPEHYVRSVSSTVGDGVIFSDWSRYALLRYAQLQRGRLEGVDLLSPTPGYVGWRRGIPRHLRRHREVYVTVKYADLPEGYRLKKTGDLFRVRR